ncbi:MAG: 2-oxoglutarate dehydrogenase, E2 component, dihydrolipoamide succinyltransferase [Sciscionella sp.]
MAFSVQMPALGESVTEGTVTRWLKAEGDSVAVDEPLLEVSTDKVDTEIPSPVAGTLSSIVAGEDDTVEVGGELALIDDGSGGAAAAPAKDTESSQGGQEPNPTTRASSEQNESDSTTQDGQEQDESERAAATTQGGQRQDGGEAQSSSGDGAGSPVTMPELGESVTEGTVTRWLKQVGDSVEVDEPLVEVSTDKVDTEIPSPLAGTLQSISANEDDTVEVGGELARIGTGAAEPQQAGSQQTEPQQQAEPQQAEARQEPAQRAAQPQPAPRHAEPEQQAPEPPTQAPAGNNSGVASPAASDGSTPYVTPLVRKLAAENSIDLTTVKGTGVGGRIRKQDVAAAADEAKRAAARSSSTQPAAPATPAASPSAPAVVRPELAALRGTTKKASRIRQITATKTRESLQNSAQLTQTFEVDMTKVARLRSRAKALFAEREGVNLTYLPFFAKAVVEALKTHPNVNAAYDEAAKEITYHGAAHLGIAVDTEMGLLSPVIHNAGDLSLGGLARTIADLAERTRQNKVKPDELAGGTFTITNIGSQGALFDTPILVPPQAAMLATGAIVKRPVVIASEDGSDSIAVRSMCYLPLTYDHRLIDGADAGRFLTTIKNRLEEGAFEADLGL